MAGFIGLEGFQEDFSRPIEIPTGYFWIYHDLSSKIGLIDGPKDGPNSTLMIHQPKVLTSWRFGGCFFTVLLSLLSFFLLDAFRRFGSERRQWRGAQLEGDARRRPGDQIRRLDMWLV